MLKCLCKGTCKEGCHKVLSWIWQNPAFHFECLTHSLIITNFGGRPHFKLCKAWNAQLFSNEKTECLLANHWDVRCLYWEFHSFNLWSWDRWFHDTSRQICTDFWTLQIQNPQNLFYLSCTAMFHIKSSVKNQVLVIQSGNCNHGSESAITKLRMIPSLCVLQYQRQQLKFQYCGNNSSFCSSFFGTVYFLLPHITYTTTHYTWIINPLLENIEQHSCPAFIIQHHVQTRMEINGQTKIKKWCRYKIKGTRNKVAL